jgi:hypothetical protein
MNTSGSVVAARGTACANEVRSQRRFGLSLAAGIAALSLASAAQAQWEAWTYADNEPADFEFPWSCPTADPGVGMQKVVNQHGNWHCYIPGTLGCTCCTDYGRPFIAFHRQLILNADLYRLNVLGVDRIEAWDPYPNAPIPGSDETTSTGFDADDCSDGATARPAGALCSGCVGLPTEFLSENLLDFTSLGEVGYRLECSGWHGSVHGQVSSEGCHDIGSTARATRDPVFWMWHKKIDTVARDWQSLQNCDIVIVLDRSGSMDDFCPGGTADPGETPCPLNDAKTAATLFADLIADLPVSGAGSHMVGLVSFSTTAVEEMPLTSAAGMVSNDGVNNTAYELALAGIAAGGQTSIGSGIQAAVDMLNDTGTNPHRAILVLTDGLQNVGIAPDDVVDIGEIQICAIGFGEGAVADDLRGVTEAHGGLYVADSSLNPGALSLEKFYVDCFGQIFESAIAEDPIVTIPAGAVASQAIITQLCGSESRLTYVIGDENIGDRGQCDLRLIVEAPSGRLVEIPSMGVESGRSNDYSFVRIELPYRGEHAGTWRAWAVRPQRAYTHGFATSSPSDLAQGTMLVRTEIHRLFPEGVDRCLYYEDCPTTAPSIYRMALGQEVAAGHVTTLMTATTAAQFTTALTGQQWDLIVFARQCNVVAQPFDSILAERICGGQKVLITDFLQVAGAPNPILRCAGTQRLTRQNYQQVVGDGRLVVGTIPLVSRGLNVFSFEVAPLGGGTPPWIVQARNEFQGGSIIGQGSSCGEQDFFYTTLVGGLGRVEAASIRPRVIPGQRILATFRMNETYRPMGGWDSVMATVELRRPGGAVEMGTLRDDGMGADKLRGNNTWSFEFPNPATTPGVYMLHAVFILTEGGCTTRREAEYSVIVNRQPQECRQLTCIAPLLLAAPTHQVNLGTAAVRNLCLEPQAYSVNITDTRGWLCRRTPNGTFESIPSATFNTPALPGGHGAWIGASFPIYACVPDGTTPGTTSVVTFRVRRANNPNETPLVCTTEIRADTGVDCNRNGQADTIDIATGFSRDEDRNGIPDECGRKCPCDFNSDGRLNSQDFFDFLTCFFGGRCPTGRSADYNMDNTTNSQDFFDFLECFFEPPDDC